MNVFRTTLAIVAVFLASGCASDGPAGLANGHAIEGVVLAADTKAPLAGATVSIEPGARSVITGADGRFAFDFDAPRASALTLTVEKSGYSRVRVDVPPSASSTLDVELPPFDRIETPDHGFRVWTVWVEGGLDVPSLTWALEVENREAARMGPVTIEGAVDPWIRGRLTEDSFSLREEVVGEIDLQIGEDGYSYTARLDGLDPTGSPVEILELTVSPDPDRITCHLVEADSEAGGETLENKDSSCLAPAI